MTNSQSVGLMGGCKDACGVCNGESIGQTARMCSDSHPGDSGDLLGSPSVIGSMQGLHSSVSEPI